MNSFTEKRGGVCNGLEIISKTRFASIQKLDLGFGSIRQLLWDFPPQERHV